MHAVVFGSLNMDLTTYAPRLPRAGETLFGSRFQLSAGGKGANQAVAVARLGVETRFFGRVGDDMFGPPALQALRDNGVDAGGVTVDREHGTGLAVIGVDEQAENAITVISGANMALDASDVDRAAAALEGAAVLLLQLEVPLAASQALAELAHGRGVTVVLDPAPAQPLPQAFLAAVDVLTPNEIEAAELVGNSVDSLEAAARAAEAFRARGAGAAVIKLGARGAYFAAADDEGHIGAFPVEAVDTVAAGDAFNGGLAAALTGGLPLREAVRWGAAAGALAVTRPGAVPAMPSADEVTQLLGEAA